MKLGNNKCVFCIPIVAVTCGELGKQAGSVLREHPDFAEWRVDYLNSDEDLSRASEIVKGLKDSGTGIIFTPRSIEEGGAGTLTDARRLELIEYAVRNDLFDCLDIERASEEGFRRKAAELVGASGKQLILSSHNFVETPRSQSIDEILRGCGDADIVKAAFMCKNMDDFMTLQEAGRRFKIRDSRPLILIAMGRSGIVGRAVPELLSSCLSFAKGTQSSAPGQISLPEIYEARRMMGLADA